MASKEHSTYGYRFVWNSLEIFGGALFVNVFYHGISKQFLFKKGKWARKVPSYLAKESV